MELTQENLDKFTNEVKSMFESTTKEVKSHADNFDKVKKDMETFKEEYKALKTSIDEIKTSLKTPATAPNETPKIDYWQKFLREGSLEYIKHLTPEEKKIWDLNLKSINATTDEAGGYLMPQNKVNDMIALESDYSPMMAIATVYPLSSGDTLDVPVQGSTRLAVAIKAELDARTETTAPTVENKRIYVYDYEANPKATNKMLNDATFPVDTWLNREWAQISMEAFQTDCVIGTGTGEPLGFTGETIQAVLSGTAGALQISTLPTLMLKVKSAYRKNGKWAANSNTISAIWGLASSAYQQVFTVNPTSGNFMLFGKEIIEMNDLPDIGASAYPIYFGDWGQACWIIRRSDVEVLRNPYLEHGFTYFYYKTRLGFKTVKPEAIAKMKSNNV